MDHRNQNKRQINTKNDEKHLQKIPFAASIFYSDAASIIIFTIKSVLTFR